MPTGGQAGRPQRGNAGGGLATVLIITADMTAFRMDSASHIETTESWPSGHGPGCGRSTGAMHLADGDPPGPTGAVPGWVCWRLPTRSRWCRTWAAGPRTHPATLAGQPGPLRSDT